MRVKWSRKALINLDFAVEYIAADNPTAAAEVARELVISGLPYILPYVEKAGVVTILRVMHTSMKWPKKF